MSASGGGYVELASSGPTGAPTTILVAMPDTPQTRQVWTGLGDELARQYRLVAVRVDAASAGDVFAEAIRRHQPAGLVLMNNPTWLLIAAISTRGGDRFPPAVIVMTSFLTKQVTNVTCATGVSYEVPLITVVTNLRKLIASPLERIGVVVRSPQRSFVAGRRRWPVASRSASSSRRSARTRTPPSSSGRCAGSRVASTRSGS